MSPRDFGIAAVGGAVGSVAGVVLLYLAIFVFHIL